MNNASGSPNMRITAKVHVAQGFSQCDGTRESPACRQAGLRQPVADSVPARCAPSLLFGRIRECGDFGESIETSGIKTGGTPSIWEFFSWG